MDVLPKVKGEYLENKRNQILDAAFAVCKRKPAYDLTMTDIVSETGMSQGGVYKYFNNIDLVLAALIDKSNLQGDYIGQIDEIMGSGNAPDVILYNLFLISGQYFSDMLISYNKILFELSTFFAYNPERYGRINKNVTTSSTFGYLTQCASKIMLSGVEDGYFVPVMPVKDIMAFIIASFDGIIRDVTLSKCYSGKSVPGPGVAFNEKNLIQCLYISTMSLLGKYQNGRE
ncbi:putative HTH-type transcriptional regulator YfiR [Lachnospiraceae bacterium]|nr:putative HTH-type transcriptional regulator YfiR [Lachnospiraceae bacterium]